MESVIDLLARAAGAGLQIELDGVDLTITGPRKAQSIVREIALRKSGVITHIRKTGCGAIHVRPERWIKRDGKAYCPVCNRYMGHLVNSI